MAAGAAVQRRELPSSGAPAASSWESYARAIKEWMEFLAEHGVGLAKRDHLARQVVNVIDGDRPVAEALDAIPPRPLPGPAPEPTGREASLGAAQADNPPDAGDMIESDAAPLDSDVDWLGDGPVPPEPVGDEDPAPAHPLKAPGIK